MHALWGESEPPRLETDVGKKQRKQVEKYLAYRKAGFSHELALRYSHAR